MERKRGLSQEALKGIACVTMLMDHYAVVIHYSLWLRVVGRLAFPIYCFLISEGMAHTRNEKKYLGRLLVMALLSEAVYDWVLYPGDSIWAHQNVLWTLLIGALVCWAMDWARTRPEMWHRLPADAAIAVGFLLCQVCNTDYGGWGVLLVTLFYLTREVRNRWAIQLVGLALFCWFCSAWRLEMLAMLSLIPLCLYNGERGFSNKALQYGFYAFYPVHILILSVLARYAF